MDIRIFFLFRIRHPSLLQKRDELNLGEYIFLLSTATQIKKVDQVSTAENIYHAYNQQNRM